MDENSDLTLWRRKQVALLYWFASTEYLKGLYQLIKDFELRASTLVAKAQHEGRDRFLIDKRWGHRNTSENWGNCAWPFLADFQMRTAEEIADRSSNKFFVTGSNECQRGMREYSLEWTTPEEQAALDADMNAISMYALHIDTTMDKSSSRSRWKDFLFADAWTAHGARFPRLPKMKLRRDVEAEHSSLPPRTGVYLPQGDPHGSPQFAWNGNAEGALLECMTFNQIGLDALAMVGRRELWFNDNRMFAFATSSKYRTMFEDRVIRNGIPKPSLAPSAVSREAFTSRPCKWTFVELIEGEYEDYDDNDIPGVIHKHVRVEAGEPCPEDGFYMTPARLDSRRYFKAGEIMPDFANPNWMTIWQLIDE
jgi:hypothetical protein